MWKTPKRNNKGVGDPSSVEGWVNHLGIVEGCKGVLSSSIVRMCAPEKDIQRTRIRLVGRVPHVLKKRKRMISKIKLKYWTRTHKFGIRIPKSVEKAKQLDKENGDTLWWDSICLEMKNIRVAFEEYDGDPSELPPEYQQIKCHMIFDIKMEENFRRKAKMVAGGHTTTTLSSLTYSSVV